MVSPLEQAVLALMIFAIMLGGMTAFLGPVLGAVLLRVINDVVQSYTNHVDIFIGAVILFVVLVLRRGILDFYMDKRAEARDRREEAAQKAES